MLEGVTEQERVIAGRYRLTSLLGRGGMGAVWCAHDDVLARTVAIKEVDLPPAGDPAHHDAVRERVLREARTAARLDHPNVVRIFDVVEDGDRPWIVMEVLTGHSLAEEIKEHGALAPARAAEVGLAVLDALEAAHRLGVVHRDVKPGNVQLCEGGRVVLTDFGIASSADDNSITRTGEVVGSPAYMSPERARGETLGPASDLFSLGATLYHAVAGQPPFDRGTPVATLTAVVHDPPGSFASSGPLRPVLVGLLAKRAEDRWDAERARAALRDVAAGNPIDESTQAVAPITSEATQVLSAVAAEETPLAVPVPSVRESGPPTDEGLPPVLPTRRRGGRLAWGAAVTLLLALAVLAGAGYAVLHTKSGRTPGSSSSSSQDGPLSPGEGGIPSDWETHKGAGYSIATPPGWYRDGQRWRAPKSQDYAYIHISSQSGSDPVAVLERASGTFGDSHENYQSADGVKRTTFRKADAATWDFTYHDGGSDLRASQLAFVAGGKVWVLWWQTKPDTWDAQTDLKDKVLSTFRTS